MNIIVYFIVFSLVSYSLLALFMTAVYAKYMLIIEMIIAFLVIIIFIRKKQPALNDFRQLLLIFISFDFVCNLLTTINFLQRSEFSLNIIGFMKSYFVNQSYYTSSVSVLINLFVLYYADYFLKLEKLNYLSNYYEIKFLPNQKMPINTDFIEEEKTSEAPDISKKEIANNNNSFKNLSFFEKSINELIKFKINTNILCILINITFGITVGMDFYSETFVNALSNSSHFSFISGLYFSISLLLILIMYQLIVKSAKNLIKQGLINDQI